MPTDNSAAWQAAAELGSTAATVTAQANLNKRTRKWNEEQYAKQRADALTDWNRVNEYNSPKSQMGRLKEAGLNPNLVYGSGAGNGASSPVHSTDTPSWNPKSPDYGGIGDSLSRYMNVQVQQAQIDNLRAQNTVILQEQMLKAAQTSATEATTGLTNVNTQRGEIALKYDDESRRLDNRLKDVSYDVHLNQISQMMNKWELDQEQLDIIRQTKPATIQMAVENLLNKQIQNSKDTQEVERIKKSIEVLKNSATLQQMEIDLKKNGVTWSDALWQRLAALIVHEVQ